MRIILDTDKKTITVPWNYQQKLDNMNKLIAEATNGTGAKLEFIKYMDDIWKSCIDDSDSCVVTGKQPVRKTTKVK